MGFMAGLGEGFSTAFNKTQDRKAQMEEDQFQVAYNQYQKNNAQYEADKKADEKARQAAKDIVQSLPNVEPGAWTYAYKLLRSGYTPGQVEDKLTTTKFSKIPTAATPATAPTLGSVPNSSGPPDSGGTNPTDRTANTNPVDNQMQASGMGSIDQPPDIQKETDPTTTPTPPPEVAAQPANPLNGVMNGIQSKLSEIGNPGVRQQHAIDAANNRIKSTVGEENFNNANNGYTPPEVTDTVQAQPGSPSGSPLAEFGLDKGLTPADVARADVDASQWIKSDNPDEKAKALRYLAMRPDIEAAMKASRADPQSDPDLVKAQLEALKPTLAARTALAGQKASVITAARSAQQLSDLVTKNGSLLTWGAKGLTAANTIKNNAVSIVDIAKQVLEANDPNVVGNEESFMNVVDAKINQSLPGWEQTAEDERALDAQLLRFIYSYGKANGVSGQSMSDKDYARISDAVVNSNDPKEFVNNLKQMVKESVASVNDQTAQFMNMPDLMPAMNDPDIGPVLKASLAPIDLGKMQGWIDAPTQDINANPLQPDQQRLNDPTQTPGSDANQPGNTPPATDDNDISGPVVDQGVIENQVQAEVMTQRLGKPVKIGDHYYAHQIGNDPNNVGIEIR